MHHEKRERSFDFKKKEWFIQGGLFVSVFLVHQIINLLIKSPWAMGDELGTLATGAYFAGYDWRSVMQSPSNYGSGVNYYGGGFGILLAPLFALIKNRPYVLYQSILSICSGLQSISAVISYQILRRHFRIESIICCVFTSVASSFFVMSRSTNAMNENMLILCVWLTCYFVLELFNSKGNKRYIYSAVIGLVLAYAYTVHTRSIVFIVVTIVLVFIVGLTKKEIKPLLIFFSILACGMMAAGKFADFIMQNVFIESNSAPVYNTANMATESVLVQLKDLFVNGEWHAWGDIFFTNIFGFLTVSLFTFGIVTIVWTNNSLRILCLKEKINNYFLLGFLSLGATWGMTVLYSINGLGNTIDALNNGICTRAHFYLRYAGAFCGPIILLFVVALWERKIKISNLMFNFILYGLGALYIIWSIVPRLENRFDQQMDFFHYFAPFNWMNYGEYFQSKNFNILILVVLSVTTLLSVLIRNNKKHMVVFFLMCAILYQYVYIAVEFDVKSSADLREKTWDITEMIRNNEELQEKVDTLYLPLISGRWETPYVVQYFLPNVKMVKELPDSHEDIIILVYSELTEEDLDGELYYYTTLNGGMYMYISGDLLEDFESENIIFQKVSWQ